MPPDAFAQFGLPRRPYLADETILDAFHRLAAEHHPDKTGGESAHFAQLTSAFETLRTPVARLKHLIVLEGLTTSGAAQQGVPPDLMDVFPAIAQVRQQIASALAQKRSAQNTLARSLATIEAAKADRIARELSGKLESLFADGIAELRRIDEAWPTPEARASLPGLHARFAFLTKWRDQLRESILQLQLS